MMRPRFLARNVVLVVILVLAGGLAACTKTLSVDSVQKIISDGVSTQLGLKIASVSCPGPDSRPMKAGDTFDCIATPDGGGKLTVTVTENDDKGNINWKVTKTEGLLGLGLLEENIKSGLLAQAKINAAVSCGGKWRVAKPDEVFDCQATETAGKVVTVAVTVKDTDGNVSWKLK